ncbi:bacteriocin [Rhodococcus rhodnii]|uniref:Type 1 encapsulin shell protein n=2 Tax=Rhodococcus rhodnii TaxID=38312 RepID=R7WSE3_9NOCA|nr:family 1 encapsulin nanocompartment shell protein [Rhodococcus rhodnii]EOM76869.1 bacteriocin protein [Rhodococcus rhodnii LMG 5362]TXG89764.1 bacteriocin [Rhodococcus rhodnii]
MTPSNHLLREHAPIPELAWEAIDDEARERLTPILAARKLAEWNSTGGWRSSAIDLGRTSIVESLPIGITNTDVRVKQRRVQPLVEVRVPFTVDRDEIGDVQRGATNPDFDDLARAARQAAEIENGAVFHGWPAAGIAGLTEASPYEPIELGDDCTKFPPIIAHAVNVLRNNGIGGPYTLAISVEGYTRIVETTEHGGYPLFQHLQHILGGQILRVPGVHGGVVVSERGGDFTLDVGQDLSVGYTHHDYDAIHLYIEESFTFRVHEEDAAIELV